MEKRRTRNSLSRSTIGFATTSLHSPFSILHSLVDEVRAGRRVAFCAVVKTHGSTPQAPGALMLVNQTAQTVGTLGGGRVEAEVRKQALVLLESGTAKLLDFDLDHTSVGDEGPTCGGGMDIAVVPIADAAGVARFEQAVEDLRAGRDAAVDLRVEQSGALVEYRLNIEHAPTLLIAGAGHVGSELARLCVTLEFRVVVVDDRDDFANAERLPPPIEPVVGDIEKTLREYPIDHSVYVVIVTRGHRQDEQALAAVVNSDARYLGMIGSVRKVKLIHDHLLEAGVEPERLDRVHAPIGLPIHAMTVPEIAVSIAAQLIDVRRANRPKPVVGPTPVVAEAT